MDKELIEMKARNLNLEDKTIMLSDSLDNKETLKKAQAITRANNNDYEEHVKELMIVQNMLKDEKR